ncbi:cysteine desulfurase family protein [Metabacillus arenae]|uniref:cysteine desulfurase n=1 Tax=Metabacillus arenae TaxID=2771434 RepID=A0A926NHP8_9BACI|nr:cysteine desulfurase family protein [Metabacillus arenae]MBD1381250.1 cysteine desulfurase [Metabacillus arenae]
MERIYLDHAATSPVHPKVAEEMSSFMTNTYGNPSSIHSFGRESRRLLDDARAFIAKSIGAKPNELIFTSGGTEADNLAIIGAVMGNKHKGNHIITTKIEHHAVLHTCQYLEQEGFHVTYLDVNEKGLISLEQLSAELTDQTILVTIMYGNNEIGSIQPIHEIAKILADHPAVFHTDAVQAIGAVQIDVQEMNVDLLSMSAHKINGPKGTGFLYAKQGIRLSPLSFGGEQELKRRAGTENVPGIIGMQKALELADLGREEKAEVYQDYKRTMLSIFNEEGIGYEVNGEMESALPHVLNVYFKGTNVEQLLVNLDLSGVAASSGSACTAGSIDPSHVLLAMFGKESERTKASIRFSFGLGNTIEEIEKAANETARIVKRLTTR